MQRYSGVEIKKEKNKVTMKAKQDRLFNERVCQNIHFENEQEAFDFLFKKVKEYEERENLFVEQVNDMKFIEQNGEYRLYVTSEEKIKKTRIRLDDIEIKEFKKWEEFLIALAINTDTIKKIKEKIINTNKENKNLRYTFDLKEINKELMVMIHNGKYQGIIWEVNDLEVMDVYKGIKTLDDVMNALDMKKYEDLLMKGWKIGGTFDGLYSTIVKDEEEYLTAIKELSKVTLQRRGIGIYGYTTTCGRLLEMSDWHELFRSEITDHNLYNDEYENGEEVCYISPEWFFGDVEFKPEKDEYPCNLIFNLHGEIEDTTKFFWVSV